MKLSQNTHKLRVIETDNELEALLLESEMVKDLLPVYNKKLRRTTQQTVFIKDTDENGYTTIRMQNTDLSKHGNLDNIYGVHTSKMSAKNSLEKILRTFQLCPKLLGIEKCKSACFYYQLHKCKGACIGQESQESYNERVELALERSKIEQWPYKSPIVLQVKDTEHKAIVIDQWIVVGYLNQFADSVPTFEEVKSSFDIDTYRILRGFIKKNQSKLTISPFNYSFSQ